MKNPSAWHRPAPRTGSGGRSGATSGGLAMLFAACFTALSATTVVAAPGGSAATAWFTEAQADQGQRTFVANCVACHGTSMYSIFRRYATAERYFNFISGSMPKHLPGSLPEPEYLGIVAFMLRTTGFPAGETALTSERVLLRQIHPADGLAK